MADADDSKHKHQFLYCACGARISQQDADMKARSAFEAKEAPAVCQMNMAAFASAGRAVLESNAEKRAQEVEATNDVLRDIAEVKEEFSKLKERLGQFGGSLRAMDNIEKQFAALVEGHLKEEAKLISAKAEKIDDLNRKLAEAERNQVRILAGFAMWKVLLSSCVLVIAYGIGSTIVGLVA
mmetsp:Transcript_6129/g.19515  ORF Transcript_6129/g.19515 Transcript_6129/m.19515 type:complete len:182 (-) Transcript_6129:78-623(-)